MNRDSNKIIIRIDRLRKEFDGFAAVDDVSLDIRQGEMFAILGGSGCGKSTLLRMLAGFEIPTAGRIFIDDVDVTDLPPYERPVNMMFQSYAVFPHMNVEKNVAYGLKKEGLPRSEINDRVAEMLKLVQLDSFAKRRPAQLSGGQQQRVALARALIKRPKVLLLDEPLAALDKKLRERTQFELINLQDQLGITFVVVTHDQEEAMTLADRVAVMDAGRFLQIGSPTQVYEYPQNRFVADFFGTINLFSGRATSEDSGDKLAFACDETGTRINALRPADRNLPDEFYVAVRPEKIRIGRDAPTDSDGTVMRGVIVDLAYLGNHSVYRVRTELGKIIQVSAPNQQRSGELAMAWEDEVYLSWPRDCSVVLDQ